MLFSLALVLVLSVTVIPTAAREPLSYDYICTYFDGGNNTGLRLAGSDDGLKWESIDVGFSPKVCGWKIFRDPSFVQGPDGTFHLCWTTGSNGFGYARSEDLINWTDEKCIKINKGILSGNNAYCWAPELYYDEVNEEFLVIVTVASEKWDCIKWGTWCGNFTGYVVRTKDFETFTDPEVFITPHPELYEIDAAVINFKDAYYCFYKFSDTNLSTQWKEKGGIHWATSSSLDGPWSEPSADELPGNVNNSEGPSPVIIDGDMVVYYDKPGQMRAVRSSNGTDWTDITSQLTAPPKFRHGTVRKLIEPPAVSARVARSRHHKPDGSDSWRLSSGIAVDNSGGKMRVIYSVNGRQCNRIGQFIAVERKAGITQR